MNRACRVEFDDIRAITAETFEVQQTENALYDENIADILRRLTAIEDRLTANRTFHQ